MSNIKNEMSIYNQNEEFLKYNVEFINGYLTSIALLRDYTTNEVGFNFCFKKIGDAKLVNKAINDELKWALERYIGLDGVTILNNSANQIVEISNWQKELKSRLNYWIGNEFTNSIKEERRCWPDSQDLIINDFIEHLKLFFQGKEIQVFEFSKIFKDSLPRQWGWLNFEDIIFNDSNETYLLHLDLSD